MDWIVRSFEEHSFIWVVISAGFGGLLGGLVRFTFETVAPFRYRERASVRKLLRQHRYPLLRAADSLDRRLADIIRHARSGWYDDEHDDYYRVSTLYLFGTYLGWCKILEDSTYLEFETSDRKAREFSIRISRVYKALSGYWYLSGISSQGTGAVPRLALAAIGELMQQEPRNSTELAPRLLSFVEFSQELQTPAFSKWFGYLERGLLANQCPSKSSARWNRLLVADCNLRALVCFLDPKARHTAKRRIPYLRFMDQTVAEKVEKEMLEMHMEKLLEPVDAKRRT